MRAERAQNSGTEPHSGRIDGRGASGARAVCAVPATEVAPIRKKADQTGLVKRAAAKPGDLDKGRS
jgi:hypothetical protein